MTSDNKGLQEQLADRMMGMFEAIKLDRSNYYATHRDQIPNKQSVQSIISSYANQNSVISGGASLVPGPLGMAAAIPEIGWVIKNQIQMIYDIGTACGKEKVLTKELLAGVFAHALGAGGLGLLTMHGSKVLVKRTSLKVFQKIVQLLAGKISQRVLKSMVSKWLPVVGAAAMAAWSNYTTREIGKKAIEVFERNIEYLSDPVDISFRDSSTQKETQEEGKKLDFLKIQFLINLMKIDGQVLPVEQEYIKSFAERADITAQEKSTLLNSLENHQKFTIDYKIFTDSPDDAIGLLIDLVALSKRDGQFHISEKMYIKQVGKLLGFSDSDIEEVMA